MVNDPIHNTRPDINPYRYSLNQVFGRLKWDLTFESFRSRSIMRRRLNKFAGQSAVILCNGPSLNKVDLTMLDGYFTIGLNKINLLFNRTEFRPSCIVAVNRFVIEQNYKFYNSTNIPLFLDSSGRKLVGARKNVAFLHSSTQSKFARDCSISIQQGFTVTYVALQLAFHMGIRKVALIGCDHNFATKGPANKTVESGKEDKSHFDPKYFSGGVKWQLPDLNASEYYYGMARETYEAFGGSIVNCTVGGKLEVFHRKSLSDWLNDK